MKALVLGAGGFLGSNLCARLISGGHSVRGLARRKRYPGPLTDVEFVKAEFHEDLALSPYLKDIDVVFHLLGSPTLQFSQDRWERDLHQTIAGTWSLLEACNKADIKRVVMASSGGAVYGPQSNSAIDERTVPRPLSVYGIHKLAAEHCLSAYNHLHGMKNVVLRISNPYGPYQHGDNHQGVVSIFTQRLLAGKPITIMGDGSIKRDFIFVDDVADAFVAAAKYDGNSQVFNISAGQSRSVMDVVRIIEKITGITAEIQFTEARAFDVPVNRLDASLAQRELGWRARTSWKSGLKTTIDWIKSNFEGPL